MSRKRIKPTHLHECDRCRFLGVDIPRLPEEKDAIVVDMYAHPSEDGCYLLWRRYGSDDEQVISMVFSAINTSAESADAAWIPLMKKVAN